jgi:hypothetical protein
LKQAQFVLEGRKIKSVSYMSDKEQENAGFYHKALVIELDDGTIFWPSSDDEGNDAGAIHYQKAGDEETILPVI